MISNILLSLLLVLAAADSLLRQELNQWEFMVLDEFNSEWRPAVTPSNIHLDLLSHGLIDDPYQGTNARNLSWLAYSTVVYRCNFSINSPLNLTPYKEIVFDGIDAEA